jgi:DNA-binding NarL/FixJ family response regulator
MDTTIRVVLANHHPMIRSNLRLLLESQSTIRVTGEASDGREAVFMAECRRPDVVLLDIKLPLLNGIAAAREISIAKPYMGIIFVTPLVDQEYVYAAFKAGARGYVLADIAHTDLISAVHVIASGGRFLSPEISRKLIAASTADPSESRLSEYEREMCCLLAAGYDQQAIALLLNSTVARVRAEYQSVTDTLQRTRVPLVIMDSIQRNHHLAGK